MWLHGALVVLICAGLWCAAQAQNITGSGIYGDAKSAASNAFTYIGHVGAAGTSGGVTTGTLNTTGANLIVCGSAYYFSGTFSDSKSNSWTTLTAYTNSGTYEITSQLAYVYSPTTATNQTFGYSGGYVSMACEAFSGSASAPADQSAGAGTATTATSLQPGSITPSQNGELIVGLLGTNGGTSYGSANLTVTDNFNYTNGVNGGLAMGYYRQTTKAAFNPTWSWTTATQAAATQTSFK